jgi:hypothetical protein
MKKFFSLPSDRVGKVRALYGIAFGAYGLLMLGVNLYTTSATYDEAFVDGRDRAYMEFRQQAINEGYAQHDAKTGVWRWKTPAEALISILEKNPVKFRPTLPEQKKDEPKVQVPTKPRKFI